MERLGLEHEDCFLDGTSSAVPQQNEGQGGPSGDSEQVMADQAWDVAAEQGHMGNMDEEAPTVGDVNEDPPAEGDYAGETAIVTMDNVNGGSPAEIVITGVAPAEDNLDAEAWQPTESALKPFQLLPEVENASGPYQRVQEAPCKASFIPGKMCTVGMMIPTIGKYKGHECATCGHFYHNICTGAEDTGLCNPT
eukprot:scaffold458755_cov34-Prasinocladus_malaysianus.AAC.1